MDLGLRDKVVIVTGAAAGIGRATALRVLRIADDFPGRGHTVLYYRYNEIIQAMLEAWK